MKAFAEVVEAKREAIAALEAEMARETATTPKELVHTRGTLRLYHNNVPIRFGVEDFREVSRDPRRVATKVRLRSGKNRFYALAGGPLTPECIAEGLLVFEPAHFIMQRKQLLGLTRRAESVARRTGAASRPSAV